MFSATQTRDRLGRGHAVVGAVFVLCSANVFAQSQQPPHPGRPLVLNQAHYRLRAGERTRVDATSETLDFIRAAKISTVSIAGTPARGFAVGPNMRGDEILLAASLTLKAGEYGVTMSAVDQSGEQRTAAANVTVDALPAVPSGSSTPPVVLLNGWQFSVLPPSTCPISSNGSVGTFGSLATQLVAPAVFFFDNCVEQSVNGSTIEELGVTLGQFLNMVQYAGGALVPQVDLVSHSMGGLIVRSYLAGLQANDGLSPVLNPRVRKFVEIATPNFGSFLAANYSDVLANGTQATEMVPGSDFLWTLATWNQRGDDLRGVDALAIIGNAGYWKSSIFALTQLNNASDGVVSLTSASLNFARDPSRTRILDYCHIGPDSSAYQHIDCSGKGGIANVDQARETGVIILSFLANTTAWEAEGYANQTQYSGGYFALENAAGTQYTAFSSVSLGSQAFEAGRANAFFYNELVPPETATFTATSTANQTSTCGPLTATGGYFSIFRCKFNPAIFSVGPLTPNVPGVVVESGGSITISGVGFGQQCSGCQVVAYPGPLVLQVFSWSDSSITALLPSTFNGIAEVVVQAAAGSDSMTFMAAPPAVAVPPSISLSTAQIQFGYTIGGALPASQTIVISNSGGGSLAWTASANSNWILCNVVPGGVSVQVSPANLKAGPYTGTISITAAGASDSPQTITVNLTVSGGASASPPTISLSSSYVQFVYTIGGVLPAAQTVTVSTSGGGSLMWTASASANWILSSSVAGGISVQVSPANLSGGTFAGTITIIAPGASNSPQTISVNLIVSVPGGSTPSPFITAVTNSCDGLSVIAPNTWIAIHGTNLAPSGDTRTWNAADFLNNQMPTVLDGVSVTLNGEKAYVYYISASQINVLTPPDLATGTIQLAVSNGTTSSSIFTAQSMQLSPALFVFNSQGYVVAQHTSSFTDIGPTTLYPGLTTPANPGEQIVVYGNGFGATTVPVTGGSQTQAGALTGSVQVQVGGSNAQVQYAGLAGPGLYQFNIILPSSLGSGNVPITIVYNGQSTQSGVVISTQ